MNGVTVLERLRTTSAPAILYHYTSQSSLLGILKENCLWATAARYLNDSSECKYGLSLISERLDRAAEQTADKVEAVKLSAIARDLTVFPTVCVASLTMEGDLLSQWRAYSNNSGGVALAFRSERLREAAHDQNFYLAPCLYTEEEQLAEVDKYIKEIRNRLRSSQSDGRNHGNGIALATRVAVCLKNEAFKEEREWRLISMPMTITSLHFRPGASMLLPFFEFKLGDDRNGYLDSIRVGPTPNPELAITSIRMLLNREGLSDPNSRVTLTQIPFRSW